MRTPSCLSHMLLYVVVASGLSGCSSVVQLSDDQIKKRDALNESSAGQQLLDFLVPRSLGGMCRFVDPVIYTHGAKPELKAGILTFTARDKVYVGGGVGSAGAGMLSMTSTYKLVPTRHSVDLKKLKNVQIVDKVEAAVCTPKTWTGVIVHPVEGVSFYVMVEPKNVDDLVADLAFFTPTLPVKKGAGF